MTSLRRPGAKTPRIGEVKILRPQEIARYVQMGYFDIGITGYDWISESGAEVVPVLDMAYNKQGIGAPIRLVLAVARRSASSTEQCRRGHAWPQNTPTSPSATSTSWAWPCR